jgi:hypothetical protein
MRRNGQRQQIYEWFLPFAAESAKVKPVLWSTLHAGREF